MFGYAQFAAIFILLNLFYARVSTQTSASDSSSPCRHLQTTYLLEAGESVLLDSPRSSCNNESFDWTIHGSSNLKLFVVFTKFYAVGAQVAIQTIEGGAQSTMNGCKHDRCSLIVSSGFVRIRQVEQLGGDKHNLEVQALVGIAEPEPDIGVHGLLPAWALVVIITLTVITLLQCCSIWYFVQRKISHSRMQAEFRKADQSEFSHLILSATERRSVNQLQSPAEKEGAVSMLNGNGNGPRKISSTLEHTEKSSMVRNLSDKSISGDSSFASSSADRV